MHVPCLPHTCRSPPYLSLPSLQHSKFFRPTVSSILQALKDLEAAFFLLPADLQTLRARGKDMPHPKAAGQTRPEGPPAASKCSRNRSKASCGNCYRRKQKVCQTSRAISSEGSCPRCLVATIVPPKRPRRRRFHARAPTSGV